MVPASPEEARRLSHGLTLVAVMNCRTESFDGKKTNQNNKKNTLKTIQQRQFPEAYSAGRQCPEIFREKEFNGHINS